MSINCLTTSVSKYQNENLIQLFVLNFYVVSVWWFYKYILMKALKFIFFINKIFRFEIYKIAIKVILFPKPNKYQVFPFFGNNFVRCKRAEKFVYSKFAFYHFNDTQFIRMNRYVSKWFHFVPYCSPRCISDYFK